MELFELKTIGEVAGRVQGELWALDQRGTELSSEQLAERVGRTAQITLCIGPDEGWTDEFRKQARFLWSLSKLQLPHRLARVVVLEQIYRAFEILRGGPYHK